MSGRARKRTRAARSSAPRGRRHGQTSPAIARAARANGAKRKRDRLPTEVLDRLGPPPATPNELRTWNAKLLAEVQWLSVHGQIGTELAASLRANAGAIDRALPPAPKPKPVDDDFDDELEDDQQGAELEPDDGAGASSGLRVG